MASKLIKNIMFGCITVSAIFYSGMYRYMLGSDASIDDESLSNNTATLVGAHDVPVGALGPSNSDRSHYRYYDSLYYTALQYGADAQSIIEVGCASDPFIQYLDWADRRTCVAPYFVDYTKSNKKLNHTKIEKITADFMKYKLPNNKKYDLLLCSQVVEHVPDPKPFMRKLIDSAETSIISVPYK
jgi:SAM-dependent methyltransferase